MYFYDMDLYYYGMEVMRGWCEGGVSDAKVQIYVGIIYFNFWYL